MTFLTASDSVDAIGYEAKAAKHRSTRGALRGLAKALGLAPGSYDIRSNMAGDAVSGEVTLHAEGVYIMAGSPCGLLVRTCKGRRDFCGGPNNWFDAALLGAPDVLAAKIRQTVLRQAA